jgi:phosphoribosylaminoimidazole (AIR) synthetase
VFINTLHGWFDKDFSPEVTIHAVVHLSGGAFHEKLAKDILFPRGFSAKLDNLWEPPSIMKQCAEWRGFSDEEFYEAWNGGQGMLLVVDSEKADYCIKRASDFGIQAKACGVVTKENVNQVKITSKLNKDREIVYG